MRDGKVARVTVKSEKDGVLKLVNPFDGRSFGDWRNGKTRNRNEDTLERRMSAGETVVLER